MQPGIGIGLHILLPSMPGRHSRTSVEQPSDLDAATKLSGARFSVLRGPIARLERALINFFVSRADACTTQWFRRLRSGCVSEHARHPVTP